MGKISLPTIPSLRKNDPDGPPSYDSVTSPIASSSTAPAIVPPCRGAPRAVLTIRLTDRLRASGLPSALIESLDGVIRLNWKSVQSRKAEGSAIEWKLKGHPWYGYAADSKPARILLLRVIEHLEQAGWQLETALMTAHVGLDKDSLFFKHVPGLAPRRWCVMSQHGTDKYRLYEWPHELVRLAFLGAMSTWSKGVQSEKLEDGYLQVKLRGNPRLAVAGDDIDDSRALLCAVLEYMDGAGYELAGSVWFTLGEDARDGDTWLIASKRG